VGSIDSCSLPDFVVEDLAASGLEAHDVQARVLDNAERAATSTSAGTQGYVLPYFDINGRLKPFYRVRLFDAETKFKQPRDAPNHVYFPKNFHSTLGLNLLQSNPLNKYVIITEGEKNAAVATKLGFPTIGLASSDAWKTRTLLIPGDASLTEHRNKLAIRLPNNAEAQEDPTTTLAIGLSELIDFAQSRKLHLIIILSTNNVTGEVDSDDQRAAALLGFELRFRGIPFHRIRQITLPHFRNHPDYTGSRVSISDLLQHPLRGVDTLKSLLTENLSRDSAFPQHPNLRAHINERLTRGKLSRKELQDVSLSVLSDLDSCGRRLRDISGQTYYFDHQSYELLPARWPNAPNEQYQGDFTQYLYRRFGLAAASSDKQLLIWLGTQFSAEDPIKDVIPQRVLAYDAAPRDRVLYQISDSQYIEVTAQGFQIRNNGDEGVLFQSGQVEPLDAVVLLKELEKQRAPAPITCWWATTLAQVRLRDKDKQRIVAALLYYLSPWLFRWRGMQLPVELVVGESGSGKSTLCELRLAILTGRPYLRNAPSDIKDWYASILNTGGLHVTDNVQFADKALRQQISDEICRIVTEPDPFVEQRKYYTNAELIRIPVRSVFAVTAIQQPFVNADILQRSFILELDKSAELIAAENRGIRYDSSWKTKQLASHGGREGWIAHHLVALQRFFQLVESSWDSDYQAKQRLINFEQSILLMAKVFSIPSSWIPTFLTTAADHAVTETDWVMSGLHEFSLEHNTRDLKHKKFYTSTISEWALTTDEFKHCDLLINAHKLSKYMRAHKSAIYQLTGILELGKENNKTFYQFRGSALPRRET